MSALHLSATALVNSSGSMTDLNINSTQLPPLAATWDTMASKPCSGCGTKVKPLLDLCNIFKSFHDDHIMIPVSGNSEWGNEPSDLSRFISMFNFMRMEQVLGQ